MTLGPISPQGISMREPREQRLDSRQCLGGACDDDCGVAHASNLAKTTWKIESDIAALS
jgi:hypothetical protein